MHKYQPPTHRWFQICFCLYPYLGKWTNLTSIFQIGWKIATRGDLITSANGKVGGFWLVVLDYRPIDKKQVAPWTTPPKNLHCPWRMMVGRVLSIFRGYVKVRQCNHWFITRCACKKIHGKKSSRCLLSPHLGMSGEYWEHHETLGLLEHLD